MPTPIRSLRTDRGLTVRQVAAAIGVSTAHCYAIERGDAALTLRLARKLADTLDQPIEQLITGRPGRQPERTRRRRRRCSNLKIGDRVEVVVGDFAGERGVVDKPPEEAPYSGCVGVTCRRAGSGLYAPGDLRRVRPRRSLRQ